MNIFICGHSYGHKKDETDRIFQALEKASIDRSITPVFAECDKSGNRSAQWAVAQGKPAVCVSYSSHGVKNEAEAYNRGEQWAFDHANTKAMIAFGHDDYTNWICDYAESKGAKIWRIDGEKPE